MAKRNRKQQSECPTAASINNSLVEYAEGQGLRRAEAQLAARFIAWCELKMEAREVPFRDHHPHLVQSGLRTSGTCFSNGIESMVGSWTPSVTPDQRGRRLLICGDCRVDVTELIPPSWRSWIGKTMKSLAPDDKHTRPKRHSSGLKQCNNWSGATRDTTLSDLWTQFFAFHNGAQLPARGYEQFEVA